MNCIYNVTTGNGQASLRRATSEFQPDQFDQTKSSLPLELIQAIQASSSGAGIAQNADPASLAEVSREASATNTDAEAELLGEDVETPQTETKEEKNLFTKIFGGGGNNSEDEDEETTGDVQLEGTEEITTEADNADKMVQDQPSEEDSSNNGPTEFDLLEMQPGGESSSTPDESLLLQNLDSASLQNMDAETLQKVIQVNNINPDVLPHPSTGNEDEDNSTPILDAVRGHAKVPVPGMQHLQNQATPAIPELSQISAINEMASASDATRSSNFEGCAGAPHIPAPRTESVKPTMIASYPGSGARLSWKLIRAITGMMTSDDAVDTNDLSKQGLVISIKSHYPAHGSNEDLFKPFFNVDRSVLLLRNPMNAMPSFLSYLYERSNNLENHSTRAPLEYWLDWRDKNFDEELRSWVQHTLFWMDHNKKENTLVMSYEDLIDRGTGPVELARLGKFLEETSGQPLAQQPQDIPCVWDFVVEGKSVGAKQPASHRSGGPKHWPYTDQQLETLLSYFSSLKRLYPVELGPIMDSYVVNVIAQKVALQSTS
eukprot:CAMPEP_0197234784 /NCGR_PEP_ID=MMETSP1429-20130617/2440_1 /TAXON_ID=49237 /ORGANISM="Chaetoceros  sp., Strain UNC1202" /LENGTH=544 /DNA_ID=CAMNT_0042693271 /DNA_START=258 /DNA_END=1892 /DNA_ORIENTATION=+